ncbi:MAG: hypothetical protein PQJ59_05315 [Spirochaetales bacterium]|nr:hypothetical protein [Spirochaetales bacterium]
MMTQEMFGVQKLKIRFHMLLITLVVIASCSRANINEQVLLLIDNLIINEQGEVGADYLTHNQNLIFSYGKNERDFYWKFYLSNNTVSFEYVNLDRTLKFISEIASEDKEKLIKLVKDVLINVEGSLQKNDVLNSFTGTIVGDSLESGNTDFYFSNPKEETFIVDFINYENRALFRSIEKEILDILKNTQWIEIR